MDIQTNASTGNYSFYGTYHESATDSILKRSVAPSGADTVGGFTFAGSYLRNQSAAGSGYVFDLTNMGTTVLIDNCSFDVAAGSSRTINVGTNTKVIVIGKGIGNTPLFTGTTTNVTYMGDNRIGVGKAVPESPLHIYQDDTGVGADNGLAIEQDGAGDAIAQFILTATRRWVVGIDNSDSDKFKISPVLDLANAFFALSTGGALGLGTGTIASSALLDLDSTTKTLLIARMTTTQKNALIAVNGMLVYDSTLNKFQGYENGAWTNLI